ncbi:MAG: DUF2062 domain-containing protein [Candidatus Omnitrophica bacterium]|nr:DUF2062 domain-containing protein [Candidatus Omnitrophota bacterium]
MENQTVKPTLKQRIIGLLKLHSSPPEIALGIAIGVFIAILPVYGLHTILVIVAAFLVKRANKISIFLGTSISTVLTFPFITWGGYTIGRFMLGDHYPPLTWSFFRYFDYKKLLHFYYPLFVGSVVLALILAVIFYFITLLSVKAVREARLKSGKASSAVLLVTIILFFFSAVYTVNAAEYAGEKIIYAISPVGTAEYNDKGYEDLNGKKVQFTTFATSAPGFYDQENIYSDPETFLPLRVERFISIFLGKEHIIEEYSPQKNMLEITKFVNNKKVEEYKFEKDGPIHNAVILPFYIRRVPALDIGWSFVARVPEQFKVTLASIDVVEVPAGIFEAYHFTSEPAKFEIWISKDEYRIPIKIKGVNGLSYTLLMKYYYPKK